MVKRVFIVFMAVSAVMSLALFGCKGRVEKNVEGSGIEQTEIVTSPEDTVMAQAPVAEPAQSVAVETIPPTAQPQMADTKPPITKEKGDKDKDIQRALKNSGFYAGAIDGKVGPRTKNAIKEFQKAKGLVVDGKVGSKTWAELEKYLTQ
ncbi:MAG: peptidoglycan-binding domain-containing protein [Candidatus Omnitrophota bacterium]|nr:peptidoglycan-binding domain-containing protein [Candidatus Omnitrophota bacterium]